MSKEEKLFRKWQHILRLDDWDIEFRTIKKFPKAPSQTGLTRFESAKYQDAVCTIKLGLGKKETQRTIVHELLHCRLPFAFADDSASDDVLEKGIERIARALLGEVK